MLRMSSTRGLDAEQNGKSSQNYEKDAFTVIPIQESARLR
ncbi:hypothetical protein W04_2730 [Pseudoalteromonas sp. SW0106-04]|nr:hypothetical protein W04_2730 [Pseudoalteromonas sp. SW0106-04]